MTVTSVRPQSGTKGSNDKGKKSVTVFYAATSSVDNESPFVVEAALTAAFGIKQDSQYLSESLYCTKIEPTQTAGAPLEWTISVTYSALDGEKGKDDKPPPGDGGKDKPEKDKNLAYSIRWVRRSKPVESDIDNVRICNSCFEAKNPPVEREWDDPIFVITSWRDNDYLQTALDYTNAVNSDAWHGIEAGLCKATITSELDWDVNLHKVTWEVEVNSMGWKTWLVDMGLKQLKTNNTGNPDSYSENDLIPILDAVGLPTNKPVWLDGHGKPSKFPVIFPPTGYKMYKELPFGGIVPPYVGGDLHVTKIPPM